MKRFLIILSLIFLSGCLEPGGGSFDASPAEPITPPQYPTSFGPLSIAQAPFPACDSKTIGQIFYRELDNVFKACKSTGWEDINVVGPQGSQGSVGMVGPMGPAGPVGPQGIQGPGAKAFSGVYTYTGSTTGTNLLVPINIGDICQVEINAIGLSSNNYLFNKSTYVISRSSGGSTGSSQLLGAKETSTTFSSYDATPKAYFSDVTTCPAFPEKACIAITSLGASVSTKWKVVAKITCLNDTTF